MTDLVSQNNDNRFAIGGIKFSEELVQIAVAKRNESAVSFEDILHLIAKQNVNIPFICHSAIPLAPESVFCVDRNDFDTVRIALNLDLNSTTPFRTVHSVGTLTLFPHKYSFYFLGLVIGIFSQHDYPMYSISTSISTVAINTDFKSLDAIVERLQDSIILPENHAPFRQEFCLKQVQQ